MKLRHFQWFFKLASNTGYEPAWWVYQAYRLFLCLILCLVLSIQDAAGFHFEHPWLACIAVAAYFSFDVFVRWLGSRQNWPFIAYVTAFIFSDILLLGFWAQSVESFLSRLSVLINVSVVFGSVLLSGQMAFLFASVATLCVLSGQWAHGLEGRSQFLGSALYSVWLSLSFFATAWLGHRLSKRLRQTEALAKQKDEDLSRLSYFNEHMIARLKLGIALIDLKGTVVLANPSAEHLLGLSTEEARDLFKIYPELENIVSRILNRDDIELSFELKTLVGLCSVQLMWIEPSRDHMALFVQGIDDWMRRAQQWKLASLGKLTASIAHEIRNPLASMMHASALLKESSLEAPQKKLIDVIERNGQRLDRVIENIFHLSEKQKSKQENIEISLFMTHILESHRLDAMGVAIHSLHAENVKIWFDASQLEQVILNLMYNAIRYAKKNEYPLIDIQSGWLREGVAFLSFEDNGPGIPPEVKDQLFNPFFTTENQGTGLGLYVCREFCELNGAALECLSPQDKGACFRIVFYSRDGEF